jgi:hypothetical protein
VLGRVRREKVRCSSGVSPAKNRLPAVAGESLMGRMIQAIIDRHSPHVLILMSVVLIIFSPIIVRFIRQGVFAP